MSLAPFHEAGFVEIGGIPQWVQIRGTAVDNPLLFFVHGGPGGSAMVLGTARREWEKQFTIVHWDQRGAGRTFERNGAAGAEGMTVDRMTEDGVEVARHLATRFSGKKIVLVAHSWGTVLGIGMLRRQPELFSAYVGIAQVTNTRRNGALRYRKICARLEANGNGDALVRLQEIGPPPYGGDFSKWATFQEVLNCAPADPITPKLPRPLPADLRSSERAIIGQGMLFSQQRLMASGEFAAIDVAALGLRFEVPIFLFSGTHDQTTPIELAEEYLARVDAPHKELVRFDGKVIFFCSTLRRSCSPRCRSEWWNDGTLRRVEAGEREQLELVHREAEVGELVLGCLVGRALFQPLREAMKALAESAALVGVAERTEQPPDLVRLAPSFENEPECGGETHVPRVDVFEHAALERTALPRPVGVNPAAAIRA